VFYNTIYSNSSRTQSSLKIAGEVNLPRVCYSTSTFATDDLNVLQCIAMCCSVMQCAAMCCNVLQCVVVCRNVLQCVAMCCGVFARTVANVAGINNGKLVDTFSYESDV